MIMGRLHSDSLQSTSTNRLSRAVDQGEGGMARTTVVCKHCGSLTYISKAESVHEVLCPRCHGQLRECDEKNIRIGHAEPIRSSCPQCEAALHIPTALVGKQVFCIACGCRLLVTLTVQIDPAPRVRTELPEKGPPASVAETNADDRMIRVTCRCGKRLKAEPFAAGRTVDCPRCGLLVTFPDKPATDDRVNSANLNCQPKTTDAGPLITATAQTPKHPPLPPHEAAVAVRDHAIDAALYCLVHGTQSANSQTDDPQEHHIPRLQDIAWLWPAAAAIAATCIMVVLMKTLAVTF